jgi:HAD superfamily hydrolase (TIGR01509 family)
VRPVVVEAVIFDLDGLLVDSEQVWDDVRQRFVVEAGGTWRPEAQRDMMGMSSTEWSRYVRDRLGVDQTPERINDQIVERLLDSYRERLPLLPGAPEAVKRLAARWPLGLASSSNRNVIDVVLETSELAPCFAATVSSEEVGRGKPAPDVYLETARRLGIEARSCVAVEDSHNGIRSADAAGMAVVVIPNHHFPPGPDELDRSATVLGTLDELTPEVVESAAQGR